MATIKEYSRQFGAQGGDFSGRRANADDMGYAGGIADLAQGIGQASAIFKKHEEDAELSDAQVKIAEAENTWDARTKEIQKGATPGVSTAEKVKSEMTDFYQQMSGQYKSQRAQQYVKLHGINQVGNRTKASLAFDADLYARDQSAKRTTLIKGAADKAYEDPNSAMDSITRIQFDAGNGIGVFSKHDDPRLNIVMDEFVKDGVNSIAWNATLGMIDKNSRVRGTLAGLNRQSTKVVANGWEAVAQAIYGQESNSGRADTSAVNSQNVTGPMQIQEATFEGLKKNGVIPASFEWQNPEHNKQAGFLHIKDLYQKFDGDVEKVAAMYYASPGVVNGDGTINYDWKNKQRPNDPTVGQYIEQVTARIEKLGGSVISNGQGKLPASIEGFPMWEYLTPDQKHRALGMADQQNKRENAVANASLKKTVADQKTEFATFGRITSQELKPTSFIDQADYREYKHMYDAAKLTEQVVNMPPAAQKAYLEFSVPKPEDFQDPGAYAEAVKTYRYMGEHVKNANEAYSEDQVKTAYQRKFSTESEISPITDFSAKNMVEQIAIRGPQAEAIASHQGRKFKLTMNDEAIGVANHMATMSAKEQTEYISEISGETSNKNYVRSLFAHAFQNDAAVQGAVSILTSFNSSPEKRVSDVADIMRGRQLLMPVKGDGTDDEKASRKTLISAEESAKEFAKYAQGLSVPDGLVASYSEAIRAHYVGSQRRMNGEGDLSFSKDVRENNKKLFEKSVEAILGKPVQSGSTKVPVPYGMDTNTFMDRVQSQVNEQFPGKYKWGQYSLQVHPSGNYVVSIGGQQPFIVDPSLPPVNALSLYKQDNQTPEERKSTWSFGKSGFGSKVYGGK